MIATRARRFALLLSLTTAFVAPHAEAQRAESLAAGVRVRVTVPDSLRQQAFGRRTRTLVGTLARVSPDTVWLHVGGPDTVRFARTGLRRVETSRGASRLASAFEFAVFSGLFYGLAAYTVADDADRWRHAREYGGTAAGFGFIVGAVRPYERWRVVR